MVPSKSDSVLGNTVDKLSTAGKGGSSYIGDLTPTSAPTLSESSRAAIKGTRWEAMDNEIDSNLGHKKFLYFILRILYGQ